MPSVLHLPTGTADLDRCTFVGDAGEVALTELEARLLRHLAEAPGHTASRADLLSAVWGYAPGARTRAVNATVQRLRRKLEPDPGTPTVLLSVYGVGYRLVPSPPATPDPRPVPLVGRDALVAHVAAAPGWVALWGPAGVGKSAVARASGDAVHVDLDRFTDADAARARIAGLLGSAATAEAIALALNGRRLWLDHTDGVLDALGPDLATWGAVCTTSRSAPTHPAVEPVRVPPLPVAEAAALFDRQVATPGWVPGRAEALARALGGLPLALVLAARLAPVVPLADLASVALADDGPLAGALAASWERLPPALQDALAVLAAFVAPPGWAEATAVLPDPAATLLALERTAWVQSGSRKNEELFHLSDPEAVRARNARIQTEVDKNPDAVQPDQSRLFGYDPVNDPLAD